MNTVDGIYQQIHVTRSLVKIIHLQHQSGNVLDGNKVLDVNSNGTFGPGCETRKTSCYGLI